MGERERERAEIIKEEERRCYRGKKRRGHRVWVEGGGEEREGCDEGERTSR